MSVLKVKDPVTGTWLDIMGTGVKGDPGGPIPTGGNPGELIVKTGPADFEVAWEPHPRVAFEAMVATMPSHATANTLIDLIVGTVTIDPDRYYHVFAGVRCIQDPGAQVCLAQFQVKCGVDLQGYDVVATPDTGLWGAWSQNWLHKGNLLNGDQPTKSVECKLRAMLSVAGPKTIYNPRLYIVEY